MFVEGSDDACEEARQRVAVDVADGQKGPEAVGLRLI
jgi:cold shock CspA family protein